MVYVGIDLHRKPSQVAAFDEDGGEILSRRIANDPEAFSAILAGLGSHASVALDYRAAKRAGHIPPEARTGNSMEPNTTDGCRGREEVSERQPGGLE